MGKMVFMVALMILVPLIALTFISFLVVFWRNTLRKWRIEKNADTRKELHEVVSDIHGVKELTPGLTEVGDTVEDIKYNDFDYPKIRTRNKENIK